MIQKLMTYDGGQPVYASDLAFMQDAFQKTVNELCKGFGDTYILYGAADGSRGNCIAGAVVISGEIYSIPSDLGAIGQNMLCFRYADTDERTFYDASKKKVKRTCEAYLSTDTSGAVAYIDLRTAARIGQDWAEKVSSLQKKIEELSSKIETGKTDLSQYLPRTYYADGNGGITSSRNGSSCDFSIPEMVLENGDYVMFSIQRVELEGDADVLGVSKEYSIGGVVRIGNDEYVSLPLYRESGDVIISAGVFSGKVSLSSTGSFLSGAKYARCIVFKNRQ